MSLILNFSLCSFNTRKLVKLIRSGIISGLKHIKAFVACCHVWFYSPLKRSHKIKMGCVAEFWSVILKVVFNPFFESIGKCFGSINISKRVERVWSKPVNQHLNSCIVSYKFLLFCFVCCSFIAYSDSPISQTLYPVFTLRILLRVTLQLIITKGNVDISFQIFIAF